MNGYHDNPLSMWPIICLLFLHPVSTASIPNNGKMSGNSIAMTTNHSNQDSGTDFQVKTEDDGILSLDGTHSVRQISYLENKDQTQNNKISANSAHSISQDQKTKPVIIQHNFDFKINEPAFCKEDVFLLIVVCSSIQHFEARQAIRDTWGNSFSTENKILFLLGTPDDNIEDIQRLEMNVNEESLIYRDIIQGDFVDSYQNLSLKSVTMLKWISTYCQNVKYVLKSDDDMYINVAILLQDLHNTVHSRFIMGDIIAGAQPITNNNSKWYTPKSVFSDSMYPKYISGTAYVISGDLIPDLYNATLHTNLFWLEDIYITGLCARKINAKHIFNGKFGYRRRLLDPCLFRLVITGHRLVPDELRRMWKQLSNTSLICRHTRINLGNAE